MNAPLFTVLMPTTAGRSRLAAVAAESVLEQSITDFELVIIGDGLDDTDRSTLAALAKRDPRIRVVDRPKHPRRGESYRDEMIRGSACQNVAYICDRDLFLPDHLERMAAELRTVGFCHSLPLLISRIERLRLSWELDLSRTGDRAIFLRGTTTRHVFGLSFAAHTRAAYERLPEGWTTTPDHLWSDLFMWHKFAREPSIPASTHWEMTVRYMPAGGHSIEEHAAAMVTELNALRTPEGITALRLKATLALRENYLNIARQYRNTLGQRLCLWKAYLLFNCPWRLFDHRRPTNVPAHRRGS